MTDKEILKVFKYCQKATICNNCQWYDTEKCENTDLTEKVLGIIDRQKAEIEYLKRIKFPHGIQVEVSGKIERQIKSDAIWEFAERLKNKIWCNPDCNRYRIITTDDIDDLVKEMTEVQK